MKNPNPYPLYNENSFRRLDNRQTAFLTISSHLHSYENLFFSYYYFLLEHMQNLNMFITNNLIKIYKTCSTTYQKILDLIILYVYLQYN